MDVYHQVDIVHDFWLPSTLVESRKFLSASLVPRTSDLNSTSQTHRTGDLNLGVSNLRRKCHMDPTLVTAEASCFWSGHSCKA